jgi:hypothetical protein
MKKSQTATPATRNADKPPMARFRTTILSNGKTAAGVVVPVKIVEQLSSRKRPPVRVTIGNHSYRSTIAVMGGRFLLGISAENRAKAGVKAGDEITVHLELDTKPRDVDVPTDFARALRANKTAKAFFDQLSPSRKQWHVHSIESAKAPETRRRRIDKSIDMLQQHIR